MLTQEMMGLALLGISWMTGLMVVLDALIDARRFSAMLSTWKGSLTQATARTEELATHEVEQRVKQLDGDAPGLVFFDRKYTSLVKGGEVELDGQRLQLTGAPNAEVWFDEATRLAAASCTSTAQFDVMQRFAQNTGGHTRVVKSAVRAGETVWLSGRREGTQFVAELVSNVDPRPFARSRIAASWGVCLASTLWVAAGTVLAFWPPVFGLVSIGGAVVLLAHFLGMTPLAMAAREKSRVPAIGCVRGVWKRDDVKQEQPVSASSSVA